METAARQYHLTDMAGSDKVAKINLEDAVDEEQFREMKVEDFFKYISDSEADPSVIWQAIKLWISHRQTRQEYLYKSLDILMKSENNISSILQEVFQHPQVQSQPTCKVRILQELRRHESALIERLNEESSIKFLILLTSPEFPSNEILQLRNACIDFIAQTITGSKVNCNSLGFKEFQMILEKAVVPNTVKWNVIQSWLGQDRAREIHAIKLIQTMNLTNSDRDFVERELMTKTFIKKSAECLEFIRGVILKSEYTNVDLNCDEHQRKLTICDDGTQTLTFLDFNSKTQSKLAVPSGPTARIASLCGELYLQCGREVKKLTPDSEWETVFKHQDYSGVWVQFVTFSDKLAVVTKLSTTICYFSDTGKTLNDVDGCGLGSGFSCTGSNTSIYAVGGFGTSDSAKEYTTNEWVILPDMPVLVSEPATVYYKNKLYVMGGSYFNIDSSMVACFANNTWTTITSMPSRRSRFGAVVYEDRLLVTYRPGGFLKKNDKMEEYDSQLKEWNDFGELVPSRGILSLAVCEVDITSITSQPWDYVITSGLSIRNTSAV